MSVEKNHFDDRTSLADVREERPQRLTNSTGTIVRPHKQSTTPSFQLASLIAPVRNQGSEARETVRSARASLGTAPHEIILVDDHSIDGSCHGMPKEVLIVRTPRADGMSAARRCGVEQSRGDVVIWSAAHCRFPPNGLFDLAQIAAASDAIVQPKVIPSQRVPEIAGGALTLSPRGLGIRRSYECSASTPALYGTIYAMKRSVYDRLGGWPRLPGIWSCSELALTLMAWYLAVPIVVNSSLTCTHTSEAGGNALPFSVRRADVASNAHFVHAAFFPQTYLHFWLPMLDRRWGSPAGIDALFRTWAFTSLRRHLQRRAMRSEAQFFRDVLQMAVPAIGGSAIEAADPFSRSSEP